MQDMIKKFQAECMAEIAAQSKDKYLKELSLSWYKKAASYKYGYHFTWMGRPIIQLPGDVLAMQELIWQVKPKYIVELGIAHGGMSIFYSSMLELLKNNGKVISVDIEIREHNRKALEEQPMIKNICLIEGSSTSPEIFNQVKAQIGGGAVIVVLDSCHTHEHVLKELHLYSTMVQKNSYMVCMDTIVEFVPDEFNGKRPWGKGNNPYTALRSFLKENDRFVIDDSYTNKILLTESPHGFLRCIK